MLNDAGLLKVLLFAARDVEPFELLYYEGGVIAQGEETAHEEKMSLRDLVRLQARLELLNEEQSLEKIM